MSGFDYLGTEPLAPKPMTWVRSVLAIGVGMLGAYLVPKHRVLGFLNAAALASNVHAVAANERTAKDAIKRMGRHVVATAGSLAMPSHRVIGYVAGAVAADLLIDGEGGGIIEDFARHEISSDAARGKVVDAEFVEAKPNALVKS